MIPVLLDRARRLQENNVDCLLVHELTELLELLEVPRLSEEREDPPRSRGRDESDPA